MLYEKLQVFVRNKRGYSNENDTADVWDQWILGD